MSVPEPDRQTVADAVRHAFPDEADDILRDMRWDGLCGCWMFQRWNTWVGVETDGYIHS